MQTKFLFLKDGVRLTKKDLTKDERGCLGHIQSEAEASGFDELKVESTLGNHLEQSITLAKRFNTVKLFLSIDPTMRWAISVFPSVLAYKKNPTEDLLFVPQDKEDFEKAISWAYIEFEKHKLHSGVLESIYDHFYNMQETLKKYKSVEDNYLSY